MEDKKCGALLSSDTRVSRPISLSQPSNRYVKSLLHWSMWKGVFHLISQSGCQVTHVAVEIFHETDFNIFL